MTRSVTSRRTHRLSGKPAQADSPAALHGIVEAAVVDQGLAVRGLAEDVGESPAPEDLVGAVAGAGEHGLRERLVDARERHHDRGLLSREQIGIDAVERTPGVDRMHDGPAQAELRIAITR